MPTIARRTTSHTLYPTLNGWHWKPILPQTGLHSWFIRLPKLRLPRRVRCITQLLWIRQSRFFVLFCLFFFIRLPAPSTKNHTGVLSFAIFWSSRATCVHMSSISGHVCVYVPTFPSLQLRGFLGSVPLKAPFFSSSSPSPSSVSSGTYYSWRHFHKRGFSAAPAWLWMGHTVASRKSSFWLRPNKGHLAVLRHNVCLHLECTMHFNTAPRLCCFLYTIDGYCHYCAYLLSSYVAPIWWANFCLPFNLVKNVPLIQSACATLLVYILLGFLSLSPLMTHC